MASKKPKAKPIKQLTKNPSNKIALLLAESAALLLLIIALGFQINKDNQKPTSQIINASHIAKNILAPKVQILKKATPSAVLAKSASSSALLGSSIVNYGRSVHVPILMYHYIGNNPNPADLERNVLSQAPDQFDLQMGYLQSTGFTPITFDTMYAALLGKTTLPSKPIILTFDDGYVDFFVNAFPILRKYNFHAVSFIPTGLMNQGYYLTWAEIKQMQSSGLISFEAHSISHPDLTHMSPNQVREQVTQSKQVLQSEVGVPVNFFAYPYGTSNATDWEIVKEAGYLGAVGTWYGTVESQGTQYDWPRVRVAGGISLDQFKRLF